jgi:hypothetical protein
MRQYYASDKKKREEAKRRKREAKRLTRLAKNATKADQDQVASPAAESEVKTDEQP